MKLILQAWNGVKFYHSNWQKILEYARISVGRKTGLISKEPSYSSEQAQISIYAENITKFYDANTIIVDAEKIKNIHSIILSANNGMNWPSILTPALLYISLGYRIFGPYGALTGAFIVGFLAPTLISYNFYNENRFNGISGAVPTSDGKIIYFSDQKGPVIIMLETFKPSTQPIKATVKMRFDKLLRGIETVRLLDENYYAMYEITKIINGTRQGDFKLFKYSSISDAPEEISSRLGWEEGIQFEYNQAIEAMDFWHKDEKTYIITVAEKAPKLNGNPTSNGRICEFKADKILDETCHNFTHKAEDNYEISDLKVSKEKVFVLERKSIKQDDFMSYFGRNYYNNFILKQCDLKPDGTDICTIIARGEDGIAESGKCNLSENFETIFLPNTSQDTVCIFSDSNDTVNQKNLQICFELY